jgi:hypothetical protein
MSTELSTSKDLKLLPSIIAETKLLRHFAKEDGAFIIEKESSLERENYFLAQVQSHDIAGFGRASTKRLALVKAIAEFYERRLMREVFSNELSNVPKVLQTSNGFAVHFTQDQATQAATNETIERHLLQYSFLKDGWNGFELISKKTIGEESLTLAASRYEINGLRAGIIIATSRLFPGVSFGYFVDQADQIEFSPRWSHAVSEAVDKIEPFLKLEKSARSKDLMPIEQGILNWMMAPKDKMDLVEGGIIQSLPATSIETRTFDLSERWGLDFPLYGAYSFSENLLPLIVVDRVAQNSSDLILKILKKFDLPAHIPERNPVL